MRGIGYVRNHVWMMLSFVTFMTIVFATEQSASISGKLFGI